SREWWARMNAWFIALGIGWLCLFALSFYALPATRWAASQAGDWLSYAIGAGWLGSLIAALKAPKPDPRRRGGERRGLLLTAACVVVRPGLRPGPAAAAGGMVESLPAEPPRRPAVSAAAAPAAMPAPTSAAVPVVAPPASSAGASRGDPVL